MQRSPAQRTHFARWSTLVTFVGMAGALVLAHQVEGAWRSALLWVSGFLGGLSLCCWAAYSYAYEHQ